MVKFRKRLALLLAVVMAVASLSWLTINNVSAKKSEPKAVSAVSKGSTKRNVMYYGDWSIWGGQGSFYPSGMPTDAYTHLNYAFLDFNADGSLKFTDPEAAAEAGLGQPGVTWGDVNAGILPALRSLRAENPNMKIGISVGGWSKSGDFTAVTANPATRAKFVSNILKFVEYTTMDFVDIDWEYPASVRPADTVDNQNDEGTLNSKPEDKENYIKLLEELRKGLDEQGTRLSKQYELSVALPIDKRKLEAGVDIDRMFELVDFANMMTYDARGAWDDVTGHQTQLYGNPADPHYDLGFSIDQTVKYLLSKGVKSNKIVIGCAFYTRGWQSVENKEVVKGLPGLYSPAAIAGKDADLSPSRGATNELPLKNGDGGRLGGVWSYRALNKLKAAYPNTVEYWDDVAKAPYLFDGKTFFTYDNQRSITEKTKYVNDNNLGGVITWMASHDAPTTDANRRDELTKTIKKGLFGDAELPKHDIVEGDLDISVTAKPFNEAWTGKGYEITIKNNEKMSESDPVLKVVEKQRESIMLPKLYIDNSGIALKSGGYESGTVTNANGITTVDLSSVYTTKTLQPGSSVIFKLTYADGKDVNINNLISIMLTQRTTTAGKELGKQVIYGSTGGEKPNTAPVFSGVFPTEVKIGSDFDAMAGVTAFDKEDGDLTAKITVTGTVDTSKEGTYTVNYSVKDSKELESKVERLITVKTEAVIPNTAPVFSGVSAKEIKVGSDFDVMAGVTAFDKEDGDLTAKITVAGTVDTSKEGKYTVNYSVEDSKGLEAKAARQITVKADSVDPGEYKEWCLEDQAKGLYTTGVKVTYKGIVYEQVSSGTVWWCEPGTNAAIWKPLGSDSGYVEPDAKEWNLEDQAKGLYTPGVKVTHKGTTYQQVSSGTVWWCEPGTNANIWKAI